MAKLILLLGGNLGNVRDTFHSAVHLLEKELGSVILQSADYVSEPWGFESARQFLNKVVEFQCTLAPLQILEITQRIEKELGRTHKSTNGYCSRPIDIDILFYNDFIVSCEILSIPHPLLHQRRFTLEPLMEHWAELVHPLMSMTIKELHHQCCDNSQVTKFAGSYSLVP